MTTIKDVARESETSVGSVSRYLNGYHLKEENENRIEAAIQRLNYTQNQTAKSLKMNRSFSIGVLVDTMSNMYSAQLIAGLEQVFDDSGFSLLLTSHQNNEDVFNRRLHRLLERSVEALIIVKATNSWQTFKNLAKLNIPVISLEVPSVKQNIQTVLTNDRDSSKVVITHMLNNSSNIGYIIPIQKDYVLNQRILGIEDAYRDKKIVFSKENVLYADYGTSDAYKQAIKLIKRQVKSIFVTNYTNTSMVLKAIQDMGKTVGVDIDVGCFGYSNLLDYLAVPVTMIKQPIEKIADVTAKKALQMIQRVEENNSSLEINNIVINYEILWNNKR